jgi:hypothetical protein
MLAAALSWAMRSPSREARVSPIDSAATRASVQYLSASAESFWRQHTVPIPLRIGALSSTLAVQAA